MPAIHCNTPGTNQDSFGLVALLILIVPEVFVIAPVALNVVNAPVLGVTLPIAVELMPGVAPPEIEKIPVLAKLNDTV
jgi:glycerol-3-phosphate responsive antiterminator